MSNPISPVEHFRKETEALLGDITGPNAITGEWDDEIHEALRDTLCLTSSFYKTPNGKVYSEAQYGGEGQGEEHWAVYRYEAPGEEAKYFRIDGYYASWDGADYSGEKFKQVWPREVSVVRYE